MDESLMCDCGNYDFWFFIKKGVYMRCKSCFSEYRIIEAIEKREFNNIAHCYHDWERYGNEQK